ncbi:hypothetical protein U1Q18_009842 [Sarracenia purpurea var. burkii]
MWPSGVGVLNTARPSNWNYYVYLLDFGSESHLDEVVVLPPFCGFEGNSGLCFVGCCCLAFVGVDGFSSKPGFAIVVIIKVVFLKLSYQISVTVHTYDVFKTCFWSDVGSLEGLTYQIMDSDFRLSLLLGVVIGVLEKISLLLRFGFCEPMGPMWKTKYKAIGSGSVG